MKKLEYINGLKGIGALMVYLCHFVFAFYYGAYSLRPEHAHTAGAVEISLGKTPLNLFYNGNAAVCLFLLFSGFVLCLSYFKSRDRRKLVEGAKKRYFRLMPVILMVNILILLLMKAGCYQNGETAKLTGSLDWFAGFNQFEPDVFGMLYESLIGCFLRGTNDYNGVLWTIPYLFSGALVVYLAAFLVGENPLRYLAYGVMVLTALKTDVYFAGIFLGFILCDFYCTQKFWMDLYIKSRVLPVLAFVLGIYLLSYPSIGTDMAGSIYGVLPPAYTVLYHLAGAVFLLAGVLGSSALQKFFSWRPFVWLGKVSFSLYLLHFPIIATASCWLFQGLFTHLGYHVSSLLTFGATTVLVFLAAALSQRYLEPLGKRLEDWVLVRGKREKEGKN